jgi:hypothetical protein
MTGCFKGEHGNELELTEELNRLGYAKLSDEEYAEKEDRANDPN